VRIAEFAWSRLEPGEGRYDFDWLERAVELAASFGLKTVIGTPTAAPPAWLTQKYPEVLAGRESGLPERHGARGHYSPTSVRYMEFCRQIAAALAQRFGHNPPVLGWQIDNEYWSYSYDAQSLARFQQWLRERYGTLDNLNRAWSNAYWSEDYSAWSQIPAWYGNQNPCLLHAGKQFMSVVYREFQRNQFDAIRAHAAPDQWITHNFHAHENLDYGNIAQDVDFVSWDPYLGGDHLDPVGIGPVVDFARGIQRKNIWVIETQPGTVNWAPINSALDKGEVRRLVWHCLGHGADAVLFWQWRSAPGGQEQYHGCLIAADGTPRPLYDEVAATGRELAEHSSALANTRIETPVALLDSYPDRWALHGQKHHADYHANQHLKSFYAPLRRAGLDVDIVAPAADLKSYRLVLAPHLHILTPAIVANLVRFVTGGGHLWLGPRTGFKDEHNTLLASRQPGRELAELLGAHVAEFYALAQPVPVEGGTASIWAEYLTPTAADTEVVLRYGQSNGWLNGQPALVSRRVGAGRISYLGAWLDDGSMQRLIAGALAQAGIPALDLPPGLEVSRRVADDRQITILINHGHDPVTFEGRVIPGGDVQVAVRR
jgi:beta-galactosidase